MGVFFCIDERLVNFEDPLTMVREEYREYFARRELAPFLLSEICALDIVYSVAEMSGGYYVDKLVLKGGLSVRNHVPLIDHRFSFDADYNSNTQNGITFGDVSGTRIDMMKYGSQRRCETRTLVVKDDARLHFVEVGYWDALRKRGYRLVERPKIEICKTCRVFEKPVKNPMNTIIDLDILGLKPPVVYHVSLEEQLSTKLFIIGSSGRQRNQFDAYDAFRIVRNNRIDWKVAKSLFEALVERHKIGAPEHIVECRRHLDAMTRNPRKRSSLEGTVFRKDLFDFDTMVKEVKSMYTFSPR